jgi:hypothetical protein
MTTITLFDGTPIDLTHPDRASLTPLRVAWGLSQINRYAGQALRPISVAEHSLLATEIAERELGLDVHARMAVLVHDAHEALCTDLPSPAKPMIAGWRAFEQRLQLQVQLAFGVRVASAAHAAAIAECDMRALATEVRDLLPPSAAPLFAPYLAGAEPVGWVRLHAPERAAMVWEDWRDRWVDAYHELDYARNDALFGSRA